MRGAVIEPPSRNHWMRREKRGWAECRLAGGRLVVISAARIGAIHSERVHVKSGAIYRNLHILPDMNVLSVEKHLRGVIVV